MRRMTQNELSFGEVVARFGIELKPCPFCYSLNLALHRSHSPHVTCLTCEADGPIGVGPRSEYELMQADAARKWNTR